MGSGQRLKLKASASLLITMLISTVFSDETSHEEMQLMRSPRLFVDIWSYPEKFGGIWDPKNFIKAGKIKKAGDSLKTPA